MIRAVTAAFRALQRMLLGHVDTDGLIDSAMLDNRDPQWRDAVYDEINPIVTETFGAGFREILDQAAFSPDPYVAEHLRTVDNRMVRVADGVFDTIRGELEEGRRAGESIPELAARVDAVLEWGRPDQVQPWNWSNRATVVARTETIAAYNAGQLAAATETAGLLGVPPGQAAKAWLATDDDRTRPTHRAADGQTVVGLTTPFDVGGAPLQHPGDPTGPPEETIQCRCTMRFHYPGDPDYPDSITAGGSLMDTDDTTILDLDPDPFETGWGQPDEEERLVWHGVLAPEGVLSGDGRKFNDGSLRWRDLPLPLAWQPSNEERHGGAVLVGRIETIERDDDGLMQATGTWDTSDDAIEARRLVADEMLRGVSVDVDDATYEFQTESGEPVDGLEMLFGPPDEKVHMVVTDGRISGATLVMIPAFQEAYLADGAAPMPDDLHDELVGWIGSETALVAAGGTFDVSRMPEHLQRYWTEGPGAGRIGWCSSGDFNRCKTALRSEGVPGHMLDGTCSNLHRRACGVSPGQEDASTLEFVSDKPWGQFKRSDYTDQQWKSACVMHVCDGMEKSCHKLPIKEPGGALNRNGVHSAAAAIGGARGGVKGSPEQIASAKRALRGAYRQLGEEPPDSIKASVSLVASAGRGTPADYANPEVTGPTPVTFDGDHLYGHLALWSSCHIADPGGSGVCVAPPASAANYAYFLTGEVETADGVVIPVGQVTMGTGHAAGRATAAQALAHYDDTGCVVADVNCGDDEYGIWLSGMFRPGVTDEQRACLRAASLSGDWRRIGGTLELVAALAVNVPGFPVPRVAASSSGGRQTSLVASAMVPPTRRMVGRNEAVDEEVVVRRVLAALHNRHRAEVLAASIGQDRESRIAAATALIEGT